MAIDVTAHISGVVFRIDVEEGATVEQGDAIITLESMKMEMPIEAEAAGTIVKILVTEGQYVDENDVVATLE